MSNRAFIIGGPGTLSSSAIKYLHCQKYEIGIFSHPTHFHELPAGVSQYPGDRHNPTSIKLAFDEFKPDVVLDFVCFTPQEAEEIKNLVSGRVRQFVFVSTVDVYGYPLSRLPMREDDPWHPETQSQYAEDKRLCEQVFHSVNSAILPLTIVRPAYSFGRSFILSFTSRNYGLHMLRRLRSGRPILVPGDGTTLMHVSSAHDTGRMIAAVVDGPQAIGRDYTCGHPTFTTHAGYVDLFARALGVRPNLVHIPTDTICSHPDPEARSCLLHSLTGFNVVFSVDRFINNFPGFRWELGLEEWARRVVAWNLEQGLLDLREDNFFDDQVIEAWQKCMQNFGASV
ncbi:MAG TPA: NAD-dependent epimerase/dehydratase family protein [Anaerolineales bacterium]|jgi:nucleoside-diphosphate-sugar epimerase